MYPVPVEVWVNVPLSVPSCSGLCSHCKSLPTFALRHWIFTHAPWRVGTGLTIALVVPVVGMRHLLSLPVDRMDTLQVTCAQKSGSQDEIQTEPNRLREQLQFV